MSQLAQLHQWHLGSHAADRFADHSAGSSGIAISTVCTTCGLARVQGSTRWESNILTCAANVRGHP